MERFGRHITLAEINQLPMSVGLMVTGTGAINHKGLRIGKSRGFFDLKWAMIYTIGKVNEETQTIAVVYECQLLDEELRGEVWDTGFDFVVTSKRVIKVQDASKPSCGILLDKLEEEMLEDIEPLGDLRSMRK